jgi:hypothetical protein
LNLETDSKGNFYFNKGGDLSRAKIPHHGCVLKVSRDGKNLEVFATGIRAPNGMGMGPNDELTIADNEGNWVPSSRINFVTRGAFLGHVFNAHRWPVPTECPNPIIWLPHGNNLDNSSGGQVWVTSDKWGPFNGDLLHTSYGTCSLFHVMLQCVEGECQGAAVRFPLKFDSGIMRGRFNKQDGQLYLCGLSVWQSNAGKQGAFQRVRYTGRRANMPLDFHVTRDTIEIKFTDPLDRKAATDPENFNVQQWNYRWTKEYGSKEYSVSDPEKEKHDDLDIKAINLSSDGRRLTILLSELNPVMQMRVKYEIAASDGSPMKQEIHNTINRVPGNSSLVVAVPQLASGAK